MKGQGARREGIFSFFAGFMSGTFIRVAEFCSKNKCHLHRKQYNRKGLYQQVLQYNSRGHSRKWGNRPCNRIDCW